MHYAHLLAGEREKVTAMTFHLGLRLAVINKYIIFDTPDNGDNRNDDMTNSATHRIMNTLRLTLKLKLIFVLVLALEFEFGFRIFVWCTFRRLIASWNTHFGDTRAFSATARANGINLNFNLLPCRQLKSCSSTWNLSQSQSNQIYSHS